MQNSRVRKNLLIALLALLPPSGTSLAASEKIPILVLVDARPELSVDYRTGGRLARKLILLGGLLDLAIDSAITGSDSEKLRAAVGNFARKPVIEAGVIGGFSVRRYFEVSAANPDGVYGSAEEPRLGRIRSAGFSHVLTIEEKFAGMITAWEMSTLSAGTSLSYRFLDTESGKVLAKDEVNGFGLKKYSYDDATVKRELFHLPERFREEVANLFFIHPPEQHREEGSMNALPVDRIARLLPALCLSSLFVPVAVASPPPSPADACAALATTYLPDTQITFAQLNAAGALPEHCEVIGAINERVSPADGQTYSIRFHLRLPTDWNRRFYYSGGGGTDGSLGNANAAPIQDGYAIVSTDSGHDNATNVSDVAGSYEFAFDPQARSDYGYNGPAQVTRKAKALIEAFYGKRPKYSYFVGCSEGGREGLMLSQRYPDFFDGIVAGNPGMDLPRAAVAEAWDSQAFARAARASTPFGNPDLASSFTDAELAVVGNAILAACDADDGLADGMLFNPQACEFDPASLGPGGTGELSAVQVQALAEVFDGARNSHGKSLYAGWYWDPGIAAFGWRQWKIGPLFPGFPVPGNSGLNVTLGGGALPFIFTTPPNSMTYGTDLAPGTVITTANPLGIPGATNFGDAYVPWVLSFDMDADAPKIYSRDGIYTESAMDFMGTSSVDYREFARKNNKLIVYTGQADPVFSTKYHERWYRRLIRHNHGVQRTRQFARLFMVPGMNHCGGGPATSQFDAFGALVEWVERGQAPDSIVATAPGGTPWPGRTRPLCAYPEQARYQGEGSIEDAANFRCVTPHGPKRGGWRHHHDDD